jgi:hypothetical protein
MHEANIRGEGKTVHVVFKYLSMETACKKGGGETLFFQLIRGYSFNDNVTVILLSVFRFLPGPLLSLCHHYSFMF